MKTVNSLSGGKTSSYMAAHYPADHDVFSLVRIDAEYCKPKDASIVRYVSDKIGMDFIATAESDTTLYLVRDLEQKIGRHITWVTGESFDELIKRKKALPNRMWRFCTTEMKIVPIFHHCRNSISDIVKMRIGFRHDEQERKNAQNTKLRVVVGKLPDGRNRWANIEWRENEYPMIDDVITYFEVRRWSDASGLTFPPDSNCCGCFWKDPQQLRVNWIDEPMKMRWFSEMEKMMNRRFKKEVSYEQCSRLPIQLDFIGGGGAGCKAGFCVS